MKRALVVLLAAVGLLAATSTAAAAVAVHVEHLDVPPEGTAEFAAAMTGPVRELNRGRLQRGEIFAWYHYEARFPSGKASDYRYDDRQSNRPVRVCRTTRGAVVSRRRGRRRKESVVGIARVHEQVERILDEGSGRNRTVIVRMAGSSENKEELIRTAAFALRHRRLSLTARDVLPEGAEALRDKKLTAYRRRKFTEQKTSLIAQVAAAELPGASRARLRSSGHRALSPLMKHETVRKAIERESARVKRRKAASGEARVFWSARSVLLKLSKSDLARVSKEVTLISDIYPNRALALPRVVEAKRLPANVEDNKASAWGVNACGALAAWGAYGVRGKGVTVAVLDTGVDASHPDLKGKVSLWAEFDFDGRQVPGSTPHDTDQHGTHVSGTIAGGNASGRWIGVAPEANIAGALVLDGEKGGTDAQVLAGIDWAVENNVDVINMSLGGLTLGPEVPSTYTEAIITCLRAGIPVVTAIGNEGSQTSGSPGNDLFAFSVGATDSRDQPAGFSGGRTQIVTESNFIRADMLPMPYSKPEISAPGVAVQSSIPGGDWAAFNGTSMATPHVAGAIALVLGATRKLRSVSPEERAFLLQDLLVGSVEELGESGQDHRYGFGRLDVLRAIGFARERGF